MTHRRIFLTLFFSILLCAGIASAVEPTARVDTGLEGQLPPYAGAKASTAVAKFEWKAGYDYHHGEPSGLRDMLSTVLVQSKRFRVLERQEFNAIKDEIGLSKKGIRNNRPPRNEARSRELTFSLLLRLPVGTREPRGRAEGSGSGTGRGSAVFWAG